MQYYTIIRKSRICQMEDVRSYFEKRRVLPRSICVMFCYLYNSLPGRLGRHRKTLLQTLKKDLESSCIMLNDYCDIIHLRELASNRLKWKGLYDMNIWFWGTYNIIKDHLTFIVLTCLIYVCYGIKIKPFFIETFLYWLFLAEEYAILQDRKIS